MATVEPRLEEKQTELADLREKVGLCTKKAQDLKQNVVDMEQKSITFYDSMNGAGTGYLDAAIRWLTDEHQDKKKGPLQPPPNQWSLQSRLPHVPQQGNGYDCGVFTSMCADYLTDDLPLQCYGQADMENFRLRIAAACMRGQLGYV